jgi:hypothetical protein
VAQRYALGQTDRRALEQARNAAREAAAVIWQQSLQSGAGLADTARAANAAVEATTQPGRIAAWQVCQGLDALAASADLLRDVFGNPFHTPALPVYWREWNQATIPRLARDIHERHRYDDLPILADALEEAGCTDEALLRHCRDGRLHVPGCWVAELLVDDSGAG